MGSLREIASDHRVTLTGRTVIGRSHRARLHLKGRTASSEHAVLFWDSGWILRDLGSRNGTFVDGRRVAVGENHRLTVGCKLRFGTDSGEWMVEGVAPPIAAARCESTSEERFAEQGILCLPSPEAPLAMVFTESDRNWILERGDERLVVVDDQVVRVEERLWRLMLPDDYSATWQGGTDERWVRDLVLHFAVSADEEFVTLELVRGNTRTVLESRAHHYLLLILARKRLEDAGLSVAEQGWVHREDVVRMLAMDPEHLNVQIFRARRQLSEAAINDAAMIIERRPGTGHMRLGTARVVIGRL